MDVFVFLASELGLRVLAPFIVESERILSMLCGVDLLRVYTLLARMTRSACVNHLLHDCVYQDGVWNRAFYQEDMESLAPVLQNEHLRTLFQIVNPQPVSTVSAETEEGEGKESGLALEGKESTQEPSEKKEGAAVSLKDLSLLYKITEKQGWYKNKEGLCYFIRFRDATKKSFDVLYPAIPSSELDSLIRQVGVGGCGDR